MEDNWASIDNARNRFGREGFKTVLCVCSAGLLRSPTAAKVLQQEPYSFNTRSCGVEGYALIPLSAPLIEWADAIVCMGKANDHEALVRVHSYFVKRPKPIISLDIPDKFCYSDPELIKLIKERFDDRRKTISF